MIIEAGIDFCVTVTPNMQIYSALGVTLVSRAFRLGAACRYASAHNRINYASLSVVPTILSRSLAHAVPDGVMEVVVICDGRRTYFQRPSHEAGTGETDGN